MRVDHCLELADDHLVSRLDRRACGGMFTDGGGWIIGATFIVVNLMGDHLADDAKHVRSASVLSSAWTRPDGRVHRDAAGFAVSIATVGGSEARGIFTLEPSSIAFSGRDE